MREQLRPYVLAWRRFRRGELRLPDLAFGRQTSFSQFGEDVVLAQLFRDHGPGFYVDVGAYDPYDASNTYLLYRRGWSGVNIEPNPVGHARLVRARTRDVNLNCAVTSSPGPVRFSLRGSFSAIVDDDSGDGVVVPGRPLRSILAEHVPPGQSIDLLDVDCEGHDLTVLQSNDWERYRPAVVLAEWHDEDTARALRAYLGSLGYELLLRLRLTGIFVDAAAGEVAAALDKLVSHH